MPVRIVDHRDSGRYDKGMTRKRKITVTIDDDLHRELESTGTLSAQLNEAGWALLEQRRRVRSLAELLADLDERDGPLPDDPVEDARLNRLLGGAA